MKPLLTFLLGIALGACSCIIEIGYIYNENKQLKVDNTRKDSLLIEANSKIAKCNEISFLITKEE